MNAQQEGEEHQFATMYLGELLNDAATRQLEVEMQGENADNFFADAFWQPFRGVDAQFTANTFPGEASYQALPFNDSCEPRPNIVWTAHLGQSLPFAAEDPSWAAQAPLALHHIVQSQAYPSPHDTDRSHPMIYPQDTSYYFPASRDGVSDVHEAGVEDIDFSGFESPGGSMAPRQWSSMEAPLLAQPRTMGPSTSSLMNDQPGELMVPGFGKEAQRSGNDLDISEPINAPGMLQLNTQYAVRSTTGNTSHPSTEQALIKERAPGHIREVVMVPFQSKRQSASSRRPGEACFLLRDSRSLSVRRRYRAPTKKETQLAITAKRRSGVCFICAIDKRQVCSSLRPGYTIHMLTPSSALAKSHAIAAGS